MDFCLVCVLPADWRWADKTVAYRKEGKHIMTGTLLHLASLCEPMLFYFSFLFRTSDNNKIGSSKKKGRPGFKVSYMYVRESVV